MGSRIRDSRNNGKYIISPDDLKEYDPAIYELLSRVYPDHHVPMDVYYAKDIHPKGHAPGNPPGQDRRKTKKRGAS